MLRLSVILVASGSLFQAVGFFLSERHAVKEIRPLKDRVDRGSTPAGALASVSSSMAGQFSTGLGLLLVVIGAGLAFLA